MNGKINITINIGIYLKKKIKILTYFEKQKDFIENVMLCS